jgi:hypothetical protein
MRAFILCDVPVEYVRSTIGNDVRYRPDLASTAGDAEALAAAIAELRPHAVVTDSTLPSAILARWRAVMGPNRRCACASWSPLGRTPRSAL